MEGDLTVDVRQVDSRLKALVSRAVSETSASNAALFLCADGALQCIASHRNEIPSDYDRIARLVLLDGKSFIFAAADGGQRAPAYAPPDHLVPFIAAPVLREGNPEGVLIVGSGDRRSESFAGSLALVEALADLAGALLENEMLRRDLNIREEQMRDLVKYGLDAQEEERESISLEIHDGVAQTLASAFQYLQTLEVSIPEGNPSRPLLVRATSLVKEAIGEARGILNSLQSSALRGHGLAETLRNEMKRLSDEFGWVLDLEVEDVRLPWEIETSLYWIIRECVINVRKHAYRRKSDIKRIRVALHRLDEVVRVEVQDWGAGFVPLGIDATLGEERFGLIGLKKRIDLHQGRCDIQSAPGEGTIVRVEIPLMGRGKDDGHDKVDSGR